MENRKLNSQEREIFASLIANIVSEVLDWMAIIANMMKVDCQTVRVLFAEAFVNNMQEV